MSADASLGIIGLGSIGAMAAWWLRDRADVLGMEGGTIGHDNCAIGGDTRLFRRLYKEGHEFDGVLQDALSLWRDLEEDSGQTVLEQCGALSIVPAGSDGDAQLSEHARVAGLPHERLPAAALAERFPQFRTAAEHIGYLDPQGGFLRTDVAVNAAVALAERSGARILPCAEVAEVRADPAGVRVRLAGGEELRFDRVALAGGARSAALLPDGLARLFAPTRIVMTWFGAEEPDRYAPANLPVFTYQAGERSIYGAPSIDQAAVKVSGLLPRSPLRFEAFEFDQTVTMEERARAAAVAHERFTGLSAGPVRATAYADLYSRDLLPVVDWVDPHQRILLASGFSGKGFKMASTFGRLVGEILLGARRPEPMFSLSRPGLS